jgi:threonine dehydratase
VVEAGGAVCTAAVLSGRVRLSGKTVVMVSGGNILPTTLAQYLQEGA